MMPKGQRAGRESAGASGRGSVSDAAVLQERVERLEAELRDFAYTASHDMQEPLRMIQGYLSLIERRFAKDLGDEGLEFLRFATDGAERLNVMLDGLLRYSRVETHGEPFEALDMKLLTESVVGALRTRFPDTDVVVNVGQLAPAWGDRAQVLSVLTELIANAVVYHKDGEPARVAVSSAADGDRVAFTVADEGIGFDPGDAERATRMFVRLVGKGEYPGSGIGLAVAQRIIDRHGGRLWFDTEPGVGTKVTFTLPAAGASGQAA